MEELEQFPQLVKVDMYKSTIKRAQMAALTERFPGIRAYMDRTTREAKTQGFVRTLFGRRIHTPGISSSGPAAGGARRNDAVARAPQGDRGYGRFFVNPRRNGRLLDPVASNEMIGSPGVVGARIARKG